MTAQLTEELERPLQIGRIRRWDRQAVRDFCRGGDDA